MLFRHARTTRVRTCTLACTPILTHTHTYTQPQPLHNSSYAPHAHYLQEVLQHASRLPRARELLQHAQFITLEVRLLSLLCADVASVMESWFREERLGVWHAGLVLLLLPRQCATPGAPAPAAPCRLMCEAAAKSGGGKTTALFMHMLLQRAAAAACLLTPRPPNLTPPAPRCCAPVGLGF